MKYFTYQVFTAMVLSGFLTVSSAADESPMDYFAEQDAENAKTNAPILAAMTIDELLELGALPKQYAAVFEKYSAEDQAELVESVKQNLDSGRAVAEKIDGDRAVVLRESAYTGSWNKVVEMSRTDGTWVPGREISMQSDSGASGSFVVSGIATARLSAGRIENSDYSGDDRNSFLLTISDILGPYLYGYPVPAVAFSHPGCLTAGSHSISVLDPKGWFMTGGAERSERQTFDENISGTLEVTRVEDGRFWANFEMTAILRTSLGKEQDATQAVNITGTIDNASNSCPGGS